MSAKARSDALRKILAQNIEQSAVTPATLSVTGVGTAPIGLADQEGDNTQKVMTPESGVLTAAGEALAAPVEQLEPVQNNKRDVSPSAVTSDPRPIAAKAIAPVLPRQEPTAIPRPEKLSILLGASELEILERFHGDARGAGIKMRKGGNPSLFVRAALRLLDQVGAQNADEWARIVAGSLHDAR